MLRTVKSYFSATHPIRLFWHQIKAFLACVVYRFPANKLIVIGITGTNGKTTTVTLTTKILEKTGYKVGMASTIKFQMGKKEWRNKTHKTTLGPFQLQKFLRRLVNAGCQYAVIETTSHAIAQHRVAGVSYDVVCITNVSPEHLDYHKSLKAYREEKEKIFANLLKFKRKNGVKKISIHNFDDHENYEEFMKYESDLKIAYGRNVCEDQRIHAQIRSTDITISASGSALTLITPKERRSVKTQLPGDFNIDNIMAATAIAYSQNAPLEAVEEALKDVTLIPGRMEAIVEGQNFQVFIDFALTENGYRRVISTLRPMTKGKLWVVFGCCGDRDQKKRPKIGEICGTLADRVIVCDDEPYTEDPKTIRDMILSGLENTKMKRDQDYFEIPDREKAIAYALSHAEAGDTVLVPGMGDFEGRTFADGIHPWSEREVIQKLLRDQTMVM